MADQDIEYFDDINENKSLTLRKVLSFVALAYTASSQPDYQRVKRFLRTK